MLSVLQKNPLMFLTLSAIMAVPVATFSTPNHRVNPDLRDLPSQIRSERPRSRSAKPVWGLYQSATTSSDSDYSDIMNEQPEKEENPAMPWTDFQDWALRDNLPRYIVSIPGNTEQTSELFALWRTMTRDVTELCGYPIDFLQDMHARQLKKEDVETTITVIPGVLPLLDEFDFESSGGVSGKAFGIPGVADGSKIETPPLADVHVTVPQGYIRTEDGSVAYELGEPMRDIYSLDGTSGAAARLSDSVGKTASKVTNLSTSGVSSPPEDPDAMLVRLGVSTGILLGGAMAVNMLSHHLTVNVFWV